MNLQVLIHCFGASRNRSSFWPLESNAHQKEKYCFGKKKRIHSFCANFNPLKIYILFLKTGPRDYIPTF